MHDPYNQDGYYWFNCILVRIVLNFLYFISCCLPRNICLDLIFLYKFDIWNICQVFDISKTPITMELNYLDILSQKNNSFSWVNRSWYSSFRFSFYASLTKAILWLVFQIYVGKTKISLMTLITIPFTSLLFIMTWNNK